MILVQQVIRINMTEPLSNKPKITLNDISAGFVKRYFLQHISIKKIIEVDKKQYNVFNTDPFYTNIELEWTINGFANNITARNGDIIHGVRHKNQVIIDWYDKKMPGLKRILTNPLEYFVGTNNKESGL